MPRILPVCLLFLSLFLADPALADTPFSGAITGDIVWTKANGPYLVNYVSIPSGSSLSIEPGTIIKVADNSYPFIVDGTLTIGSAGGEQVVITSMKDDVVGGDSNGDGAATTPQAGDWRTMIVGRGAAVHITNTAIRYGGLSYYDFPQGHTVNFPLIENNGGILTLEYVTLAHSAYSGLHHDSGITTITNSVITNTATYGILMMGGSLHVGSTTIDTVWQGIAAQGGTLELGGNTFTNLSSSAVSLEGQPVTLVNHGGNIGNTGFYINQTVQEALTLPKDGLAYVMGNLTVPVDTSLTILPGAIVKVLNTGGPFFVSGTLTIGSEGGEQVFITSITDDTVGGDTNNDGTATTPQAGDWRSITLNPNSSATIRNTTIRYGGASPFNPSTGGATWLAAIKENGGTLMMDHVAMTDNGNFALLQEAGTTTITHSTIARTSRYGIFLVDGTLSITDSSIHDNATYGVFNGAQHSITATHNWWGSATGPTHAGNPQGTGDRVSDYVDYAPWLGQEPGGSCVTDCFSNVLFLPGIMGSRLYDSTGNVRWLPADDEEADYIRMNSDGASALPDITTKDAIDTADFQQANVDIYKSFLNEMQEWEATYGITATTAPYDWRLDYDTVVTNGRKLPSGHISYLLSPEAGHDPYIIETLKQLAATSKTGKVTIIAHSQGGLVTKALTNQLGMLAPELIDKIVFVAVSQLGTPEAIARILHGEDAGIVGAISDAKVRALAQHTQSAFNLLPSANYFTYVDDPVITASPSTLSSWSTVYGNTIHSEERMQHFMADSAGIRIDPAYADLKNPEIVGQSFLNRAAIVHNILDRWTPPAGVQLITIAGWGEETLSGIDYKTVRTCVRTENVIIQGRSIPHCAEWGRSLTHNVRKVIDGDGTVVEPSALWGSGATSTRYWVDLATYNKGPTIDRDHKNILEVPTLRTLIKNTITETTSSLQHISAIAPAYDGTSPRLHFTLHSPLTLGFTDSLGNYTGATATGTTFNIPGVDYERYGEVQWLSVPKELAGQLIMRGTDSGSFTLDIAAVNGNETLSTTSFEGIPSSTSTMVTMNIDPLSSPTTNGSLVIDTDGDGASDLTLPASQDAVVLLPKFPLTVTPDNRTMILGALPPQLTTTISGFLGGDTASTSIIGSPSCTTTATNGSPVGTYPITCTLGTLASDTYDFTFATGTLAIVYKWSGFSQPINDTAYHPEQTPSVFKRGSTIPVKFQLKNASGIAVQSSTSPIWLPPERLSTMSASVGESTYSLPATSGTTFMYDLTTQQYVYNWSTKGLAAGYWYRIYTKLEDGTIQSVVVGIR